MKSLLSPNSASCVVSAPKNCFPKFRTFSASPTLVQVVVSSQCFIRSNQQQQRQQIMLCSAEYFSARKPRKFVHYTRVICLYLLALVFFLLPDETFQKLKFLVEVEKRYFKMGESFILCWACAELALSSPLKLKLQSRQAFFLVNPHTQRSIKCSVGYYKSEVNKTLTVNLFELGLGIRLKLSLSVNRLI